MNLATLLLRLCYWFEAYSLEIQLDGQNRAIAATTDVDLYFEMIESRRETRKELAAARANYTATFRPGIRFQWEKA